VNALKHNQLHYFNELEEAKKCFEKYCEWYVIPE
jgi:hypothetical protein